MWILVTFSDMVGFWLGFENSTYGRLCALSGIIIVVLIVVVIVVVIIVIVTSR